MEDNLLEQIQQERARRVEIKKPEQDPEEDLLMSIMQERERRKQAKSEESFFKPLLDTGIEALEFVDSVSGAPARAAVSALQQGGGAGDAMAAFGEQFLEDPNMAPTGKQIAERAGFDPNKSLADISPNLPDFLDPTSGVDEKLREQGFTIDDKPSKLIEEGDPLDISSAGGVGFGIDLVVDPLAFIPVGAVASKTLQGAKKSSQFALKGSAKAANLATGGKAGKVAEAVSSSSDSVKKAVGKIFNPKVADDFKEFSEIAKKNNIDPKLLPESVEFGKDSFLSRSARGFAEGPLGEEKLESFNNVLDKVSDAFTEKVKTVGGGEALDSANAGNIIREGFDRGVERFFNEMDFTYNSIQKMSPDLQMSGESLQRIGSKLSGVERNAIRLARRGVSKTQRAQAAELLNATKAIRSSNGSFKQAVEAMRDIGEVAFSSKNSLADVPSDVKNLRKIYTTLKNEVVQTVRDKLGDDIADNLVQNNRAMAKFFDRQSIVSGVIGNKNLADEKVFSRLILSGDTKKIEVLKSILSPEDFNKLKGAFLNKVVKTNIDGDLQFRSAFNALKNKQSIASSLFEPEELKEVVDILRLGDRMGSPVLSSSGTGASNVFRNIGKSISSAIENESVIEGLKGRARKASVPKTPNSGGRIGSILSESASPAKKLTGLGRALNIQNQNQKLLSEKERKKNGRSPSGR